MLQHPDIDPVAIHIGPLAVHWYGIMYLIAFLTVWGLGRIHARRTFTPLMPEQMGDLVFYGVLGTVLGGRIGYILFYSLPQFLEDPLLLFRIWQGGMSFHGGLLGVILAVWLYARRYGLGLVQLTDFAAPLVPIGLGAGRIGNFINAELWGAPTTLPWGMVFPGAGPSPRHPSQLYEAALEGLVLFVILWTFARKPRPLGAVSGLFLLAYGSFRFMVEFVRMPDAHLGYLAFGWLTMGQILSLPMIVGGIALLVWAYYKRRNPAVA